jgi:hypothetical protein
MDEHKLGKLGTFPDGKIRRSDEGAIKLAVTYDPTKDLVLIDFGTPVVWLGMKREQAAAFAALILKHAKGE